MARKKVTHQTQDPKQQNPQDQNQNLTTQNQHQQPSMEDPNDRFQSLKTVNELLVKEAKQRRQQVESLVKAKEALEFELALDCKEKSRLENELGEISDGRLSLEWLNWRRGRGESEEEIKRLKKQYALLVKEIKGREKEIEELQGLRGLAENNLVEKVKEIEDLKREIGGGLLRKGMKLLEEGVLRGKSMELEKSLVLALEKEKAVAREIDGLLEEKKEKERTIVRLMEEKDDDCKYKIMVNAEIENKKGLIEKLLREKNEIEEVKLVKEGEIAKLHEEVGRLFL
ncbi:hypothetical protein OIU84_006666, partial [Salix udensis]